MLQVLGFERLGVVLSDLYFLDPNPGPGQEGAERGVRLELRFLEQQPGSGSVYASRPIVVGRPLWRVDLLESVANPGTLDRAHHHPKMQGWEPGFRRFEAELSAHPLKWLGEQLEHLEEHLEVLEDGESDASDGGELSGDFDRLRRASGEILEMAQRMLERVNDGELARTPSGAENATLIRSGWL